MNLETRLKVGDHGEEVHQGSHNSVKVEVNVVRSNIRGELFGSISRLLSGILRTHVAGVKKAAGGKIRLAMLILDSRHKVEIIPAKFLACTGKPG